MGMGYALPSFARKYDMDCVSCHAQGAFPRLNDVGFKFRRAGFRLPEDINQDQSSEFLLQNYFAMAAQDAFHATFEKDSTAGEWDKSAAFESGEFDLWPLTGSLGKNWGTQGELAISSEGEVELENSNVRFASGTQNSFFSARAGVFHALEGYGASDRPIGLRYPLFMETVANRNQETLFTMVEPSLFGVAAGYAYGNSNFDVTLSNSGRTKVKEDELEGTHLMSESNSPSDVQVTFTQILGENGSGFTAYYYTGRTRLPKDSDAFIDGTDEALFSDRFHRGALFGTYYPTERLGILTGIALGRNKFFDTVADAIGGSFNDYGAFGEIDYFPQSGLGIGARYDYYDPATDVRNTAHGASAFINYTPAKFLQFIVDYQYLRSELNPVGQVDSHNVVTRVMFLY